MISVCPGFIIYEPFKKEDSIRKEELEKIL